MPFAPLVWAALLSLGAQPAKVPGSREARDELIFERRRAQNRLVSDLAVHTMVSAACAHQVRPGSHGDKCWAWAFAVEGGFAVDRQDPGRGGLFARSLLLGWQPLTFGSWYFRDEHRFGDLEAGFVEPYLTFRAGALYDPADGGSEVRKFLGLIVGSRAWVGWTIFRAGFELSYEFGPPELARGPSFAVFAGLAMHYAPLRGAHRTF
ncbi:MAG: hypothetical protein ACYC8T_08215 [Myxococcaceae bacterium]